MTRRFQFSLRALLALMTAVALLLTWIFLPIFQLRRQRQIADAFSKRGAWIFPNMKRIYLAKTDTTEDGITKLRRRLGHLPTLSISW